MATYTLIGGPISASSKSVRVRIPRFEVPSLSETLVNSVSVTLPFRLDSEYSVGDYPITLILCTGISNSNWYEYDNDGYSYYGTDTGKSADRIYSDYYSHVIPSSKILATTTGTVSFSATQTNTPTTFTFSNLNLPTSSIGSTLGVAVLYSNTGALEYYPEGSCTGTITTLSNYTITYWAEHKEEYNDWPSDVVVPLGGTFTVPTAIPYRHYDYSYNNITLNYNYNGSTNETKTITNYKRDRINSWIDRDTEISYERGNTYTPNKDMTLKSYYGWWGESLTTGFTLPTPTRSGYKFNGWYSSSSGGTEVGKGGDTYTNTDYPTIYAQWTADTYTISYNANGGSNAPSSTTAAYGSSINLGSAPTRSSSSAITTTFNSRGSTYSTKTSTAITSYSFEGWALNSTSGTIYSAGASYTVTGDATFYAKWGTASTAGSAVSFPSNPSSYTSTIANTCSIILNANYSGGTNNTKYSNGITTYSFKNWNTNPSGTGTSYTSTSSYKPTSNATLYAQWNSSTTYNSIQITTSDNITRTGYKFKGWSKTQNGSVLTLPYTQSFSSPGTITLYAIWEKESYLVSYDANGGSGAPENQTKYYGETLVLSGIKPTKTNTSLNIITNLKINDITDYNTVTTSKITSYSFKEWNTQPNGSGISYLPSSSYSANTSLNLYAQYSISNIEYETFSIEKPTLEGYSFLGWSNTPQGEIIWNGEGEYQPTSNQTLYAQWELNGWKKISIIYYDKDLNQLPVSEVKYYNNGKWIDIPTIKYFIGF